MSFIGDIIELMGETGIIDLFFPWLLLLAFTFGIFQKYEFFEDEAVNGAISLATSFMAIAGIYFFLPEGLFMNFGAILAFAAFAALGFMIVMAISGIDINSMEGRIGNLPIAVGASVLFIGLLVLGAGAFPVGEVVNELSFSANVVDDILMPMVLLGFILAVIFLTSE